MEITMDTYRGFTKPRLGDDRGDGVGFGVGNNGDGRGAMRGYNAYYAIGDGLMKAENYYRLPDREPGDTWRLMPDYVETFMWRD
jgi:hypothetical protein